MIFNLFLVLHVVVAFFLIIVILLQGGRGGLGEALGGSGGSSLFGGSGNVVMTKVTAVGAAVFMVTCLLLAKLSTERGRSVIEQVPITLPDIFPGLTGSPAATPEATVTDATTSTEAAATFDEGEESVLSPFEDPVTPPEELSEPISPLE